jgi:signal transduction histidine kinase
MIATIGVCAPLLVLLAVPGYHEDHRHAPVMLVVAAWCLAGAMVATILFSLTRRDGGTRAWLWGSIACFIALILLEPFTLERPLAMGSTPWLLALAYIAVSCAALAEFNPIRAGVVCAGIDVALTAVYARDLPPSQSAVNAAGLALAAGLFIVTIRFRRLQADRLDLAEQYARALYAKQHRDVAVEMERVRTDALLHDSVLATLSSAAGQQTPESTVAMARTALGILDDSERRLTSRPSRIRFEEAVAAAEEQFAPLRRQVDIDLDAIGGVELPADVAEALVAATLQAVTNSITHAGPVAHRLVTATRTAAGGVRITVADDGHGFAVESIGHERLGVRVSIVERIENVGGTARVRSIPGKGSTVELDWSPVVIDPAGQRQSFGTRIKLVPRRHLYRFLGAFIVVAIVTAVAGAALVSRAIGPVIAAVLGLILLPALIRGARTGSMRTRTAWSIAAVALLLCSTATIGLDADTVNAVTIAWYTCGILAGCVMVWMAGHRAPPLVAVLALATQLTVWAGPTGIIRLGLAAEIVLIVSGVMMHRTISSVTTAADLAAVRHREISVRQNERDAFDRERQHRLRRVSTTAGPMLRYIVECDGYLSATERAESRVLEQALRDEIRGRRLLNDAMRSVVSMHRRRGTQVQVLDDGGLDTIDAATLDALLDDVARRLEPVTASRIIVRTGRPDSDTAITLVATTPNGTAAALGLNDDDDDDDHVELWETIPRPAVTLVA